MTLTPELLGAAARKSVRMVGQELLGDLVDERARLGEHPDALHDFRVALRRLRSWLRAFRPLLRDTVRSRTYRELAAIADASGAGRDAEVALEWLAHGELPARAAAGGRYLATRLRADKRKAMRSFRAHVEADFEGTARRLGGQLASYRVNVAPDEPVTVPVMGEVFADTVRYHVARFRATVLSAQSADDVAAAHEARIAGKRLRYLLEQSDDPGAAGLVEQLARIQDTLGALHDAHVLIVRIADERAMLAKQARVRGKPDPRRGLYLLAAHTRTRSAAAYAQFRNAWEETGDELLDAAARIAGSA
jgi:CHAD domain-containing protein